MLFRSMFLFGLCASYCGTRCLCKQLLVGKTAEKKQLPVALALPALSLLCAVYVLFCGIQVVYLFAGHAALPEGFTYAQYARQGFFQLLAVCALNLLLVLGVLLHFPEQRALKALLLFFSLCTFVMIASSGMRMLLYIQEYKLTFARILVLWTLAVLSLLLCGIVAQIARRGFPLFRYGFTVFCLCYAVLALARPDYWTAQYNLSRIDWNTIEEESGAELWRLGEALSLDAMPVFAEYQAEHDAFEYAYTGTYHSVERQTLRRYNVSRARAYRLWTEYDVPSFSDSISDSEN